MKILKKAGIWLSVLGMLVIQMGSSQAAMVDNSDIVIQMDRAQIVSMLEREEVQQQLVELGVDPAGARARVDQMTSTELAELNGNLSELVVGAGVSTVELLLIIIIVILIL